ncbi:nop14-like family domain-containing protein [Ditylenchus destructor]|nr:nop14-like family domain-containing protein [Ditylenchus destructor]
MAKSRKKSKASGAKASKEAKPKRVNPFDLVFKKRQQNTLANSKHSTHAVASSRKKGMEDRKATIGVEYKNFGKTNSIIDKRIAQRSTHLSADEKAEKRFALQRRKIHATRSRFNLDDDEDGDDLEKEDGIFSRENEKGRAQENFDDDDEPGELGPDLVAMANFGGGSFGDPLDGIDQATRPKRRDVLANLIAMSKQSKAVRQMENDARLDVTDRLNEKLASLQTTGALNLRQSEDAMLKTDGDGYDALYRDLQLNHICTRPKAVEDNASKSQESDHRPTDFASLLSEYMETAEEPSPENIQKIGATLPHLYALAKKKPGKCGMRLLESLQEHHEKWNENPSDFNFSTIALIQLIGDVYSTLEKCNPIVAPALIYASEIISTVKVTNLARCAKLVMLCGILSRWIEKTKRYLPEVIAFLHGCLMLCVKTQTETQFPTMSFPTTEPDRHMLYVDSLNKLNRLAPISISNTFNEGSHSDSDLFRLQTIRAVVDTTKVYIRIYSTHTISAYAVFRPFWKLASSLPIQNYPKDLAEEVNELLEMLAEECGKKRSLTQLKVQPRNRALKKVKFLEPRIEEHFNPDRSKKSSAGKAGKTDANHRILKQKLKKETRGAMKELRMDAKYLARMQHEQGLKISRERNEKTKRILQSLQGQESEYKKRKAKKF